MDPSRCCMIHLCGRVVRSSDRTDSGHMCKYRFAQPLRWSDRPCCMQNDPITIFLSNEVFSQISGPNLGRNSSGKGKHVIPSCNQNHPCTAAFALSSGTIGAALSSSLSKIRSIALSYGTVRHPTPLTFFEPAHHLSGKIIQYLWSHWGQDDGGLRAGEVDLYNINIPLVEALLSQEGLKICSTTMWRNSYGSLFKAIPNSDTVRSVGPDPLDSVAEATSSTEAKSRNLCFKFGPNMNNILTPPISSLPIGSDGWAIHYGWASVTPLRASFAEPPQEQEIDAERRLWKMKL